MPFLWGSVSEAQAYAILSTICAAITIALVVSWAKDNPSTTQYNSTDFLKVPDWETNQIAYHITLMAGGFFAAQLIGGVVWLLFSEKIYNQIAHIILQSVGLITMCIGLYAAVSSKNTSNTAHLTTMHSWFGIACIVVYILDYVFGFVLGGARTFMSNVDLKTVANYRVIHGFIGQIALGLSLVCVISGILVQLSQTGCYYINVTLQTQDLNPTVNYYAIPDACKLANGMGLIMVIGTLATFLAIHYRKKPVGASKGLVAAGGGGTFTMAQVATHDNRQSCWIVVKGKVYDATSFLASHPGGATMILNHAGTDCSNEFEATHSQDAWTSLNNLYIGDVDANGAGGESRGVELQVQEMDGTPSINSNKFLPFPLIDRSQVSHDVVLLRFGLPSDHHILGLPVGNHLTLQANINGKAVSRSYTPTSSNLQHSFFDLVVKVYAANQHPQYPRGGLMSQYLNNLSLGQTISVKGPTGHITYAGRGSIKIGKHVHHGVKHLVTIAAGSGITPMYQVITAIMRDKEDKVKCHLLFANRTEYDILLMSELDMIAERHPNRLYMYHTLSRPVDPAVWAETGHFTGYVNAQVVKKVFPPGGNSNNNIALLCGPQAFCEDTCIKALKSHGYPDNKIGTF